MPFNDGTNLNNITKYIVDAGGGTPYTTVQSALDAANAEVLSGAVTAATVYVRPGIYNENLIAYDKVDCIGSGQCDSYLTTINGTHTPPLTGYSAWFGLVLTGTNAVFQSAAAGTATIGIWNVVTQITGAGYTFDIPNWAGELNLWGYLDAGGANNGWINNATGSMFVNSLFAGSALTQTNTTALINGSIILNGMLIGIKIRLTGNAWAQINMGCELLNTIEVRDNATADIQTTYFLTGAEEAINTTSTDTVYVGDITINGTANPIINGTGTVRLGAVTFMDSNTIAPTITQDRTTTLVTGVVRATTEELIGSGAGAQEVIDITPAVAIGGVHWDGIHIDGAALDPTVAAADIHGMHIDLEGVSLVNDPIVVGMRIEMPAAFTGDAAKDGLVVEGFGYEAELCSGDHDVAVLSIGPMQQEYDGTGAVAGITLAAIDSIIDYDGSTGGMIHAFNVSVAGTGTATPVGLATYTDVAPIHQHIGAFGAVAQGWKENGGFTDSTAAFNAAGVDVTVFDADNDYIYIGANAIFDEIQVILDTPATRSITPIFEYSIGGPAWTVFTPIDNTDGFTQNGSISFNSGDLAGWASVIVNAANHFYIRIQRTRNNIGVIPIEDTIQILASTMYSWDETGVLDVAGIGFGDETMSNYDEGTWTATLSFGGASVNLTYGNQAGKYTRIGDLVFCTVELVLTNKGTSNGNAVIGGLPFTVAAAPTTYSVFRSSAITFDANYYVGAIQATPATTTMALRQDGTATYTSLDDANFANNSRVLTSFFYYV